MFGNNPKRAGTSYYRANQLNMFNLNLILDERKRGNMSFAETTAMGNVGKVPEVRYSAEGKEYCHFSVAVNENTGKKDKDGKAIREVTWFNITCVGSLVNVATSF